MYFFTLLADILLMMAVARRLSVVASILYFIVDQMVSDLSMETMVLQAIHQHLFFSQMDENTDGSCRLAHIQYGLFFSTFGKIRREASKVTKGVFETHSVHEFIIGQCVSMHYITFDVMASIRCILRNDNF